MVEHSTAGTTRRDVGGAAYDTLCDRLRVVTGHDGRNGQWRCPAHDDRSPSLSVDLSDSGVLLHCHAGCPTERVVDALNLRMSDLFDEQPERPFNGQPRVKAYRPNGHSSNGSTSDEVIYPYTDEHGELLFQVVRGRDSDGRKTFRQRRPDGHGGWTWNTRGVRKPLYRLPEVAKAVRDGQPVVVVEGEKDVETVEQAGGIATCNPGGAGKWLPEHTQTFAGYGGPIIVVADHDRPGYLHAAHVYDQLAAAGCTRLFLVRPGGGHKDISDQLAAGIEDWADLDDWDQIVGATDEADTADNSGTRLPEDFWTARPELEHVRQAALARRCNPDALLHYVLARISAFLAYTLRLPPVVRAPAPLNYFVAPVGLPGAGKSSTNTVAAELLPPPEWVEDQVPLGSGEGLAELLMGTVTETDDDGTKRKVRRQVHHNAYLFVDEGKAMMAVAQRQGSTVLETIRTVWTGGTLGQANANEDRKRIIPAHSYAYGLVVGFQVGTVAPLLDDSDAGTPQRFAWCEVDNPGAPDHKPDWPGPLHIAWPPEIIGGQNMGVDAEVAAEVDARDLQRHRRQVEVDLLDVHGDLLQLKIAGLLAVLNGRTNITADDWHLAALVRTASDAVRNSVQDAVRYQAQLNEQRAVDRNTRRVVAADTATHRTRVVDGARKLADKVHGQPGHWTRRRLRNDVARRWREVFDDAYDHALAEHWIVEGAEHSQGGDDTRQVRPGEKRP